VRRTEYIGFDIVKTIVLLFLMVFTLAPVLYLIYFSLIHPEDYFQYGLHFPLKRVSLQSYRLLLTRGSSIVTGYVASIYVTVTKTAVSLILTAMLAYPLSKRYFPLRTAITFFVFFTMLFSGGLVPTYLLVRSLGLTDTIWSLVLPSVIMPWYLFLFRNFLYTIPSSLEESARLDGASDIAVLFRIVLPNAKPALFTIGLFYAVSRWNNWFDVIIYTNSPQFQTLQVELRSIIYAQQRLAEAERLGIAQDMAVTMPSEVAKTAAIVVSTIPIMAVYPFIQKHFVKGALLGSIKG
jgi:putative aldouronate transport system permease protein